jgi:hypothetical protein
MIKYFIAEQVARFLTEVSFTDGKYNYFLFLVLCVITTGIAKINSQTHIVHGMQNDWWVVWGSFH